MRVVFAGGGTGGHVYPIVAIARQLKKTGKHRMYFIGPHDNFSQDAFENEEIQLRWISAGSPSKGGNNEKIKIAIGVMVALWHLFWIMPDVIFSKGGYGAAPVLIAAWVYNIPIVLHDSDTIPGLVTKKFASRAKMVLLSFSESTQQIQAQSVSVVGHPVRRELAKGDAAQGQKQWNIGQKKPVALILGGSQGAQPINDLIMQILPRLLKRVDILHISGKNNINEIKDQSKRILDGNKGYVVIDFLNEKDLATAYALSTLVISRAGAGSIFELAYLQKPSIIIPLPHAASDHQRANARIYAQNGAAIILEEENTSPNLLLDAVNNILTNTQLRETMSKQAHDFSRIDADIQIAKHLLTYE